MTQELNPYAPPPLVAEVLMPQNYVTDGVWRDGKLLVVAKGATLPPRCIKSNEPTNDWLKRNLVWYPPWIALTILIAWPIFVVLALILQKKATINIGLTPEWKARRWQRIAIGWGTLLLGITMFVAGLVLLDTEKSFFLVVLLGLFTVIGGGIYTATAARLVTPTKIDDRFAWLKGVCPAYLAELPPWPGTR